MTPEDVKTSLISWSGHMRRFDAYYVVRGIMSLYRELFAGLEV